MFQKRAEDLKWLLLQLQPGPIPTQFAGSNVHRENVEPKELRKLRLRGHSRANKDEVYTRSRPVAGCVPRKPCFLLHQNAE